MNKRIKELMPLAYELVRKRHGGYFTQELLLQYMAELVVKDCASICDIESETYKYSFTPAKARLAESTAKHCGKMIKQHFRG